MSDAGNVNFRALQLFIAVYDSQSFSVVARREGVSPSMVSRTIHQLEDALGQQLFYRNTRAVVPTEAGRLFAAHARGISEQFSAARRDLQDRNLEPGGLVRINAPVYFGQRHIAPWLPGLTARYPQMQIELALNDDFIDPHRDATDVIFRIGSLPDSSVHARVLGMQHHYLVAAPAYLRRRGIPETPEDLRQHSTLVYSGSNGPNRWLFRLAQGEWVHYPQTPQLTSNNADALLTAALGGMGVVLFPDWMVNEATGEGRLIQLMPRYTAAIGNTPSPVSAIYPHARHPSLNVRAVIDYFIDVFGTPLYWQR
ncbi:LysR family transcriptional regulator [Klebsiella pasteurii]|uniref:LysR family transcriptional regulator n=1 Tax=Klebsiella pasteurii TaxID=2587529 RepID=UPI00115BF5AC|nr:LysR family transcriptional regulator [Klebsiella pasteurii]VUT20700.1 HTH-type transcriptional regulator DmlR [Klebsiella pasteurii]